MSHVVKSAIDDGKILKALVCFLAIFSGFFIPESHAQSPVNYTMQTGNFDRTISNAASGAIYNNGASWMGMWMNGDLTTQGDVAWKTFKTAATGGAARELQIGDEFSITLNTKGVYYGTVGVSLNDGNDFTNDNFTNRLDNSRIAVIQNGINFGSGGGTGSWYVNAATAPSLNNTPNGSLTDYTIKVKITSNTTANVTLGSTTLYDLAMNGSAGTNIDSFSVWLSDDRGGVWNVNSGNRGDVTWKAASVADTGTIELGYAAPASATRTFSTVISDGLSANSTSSIRANSIFIGGDAGSQVNLTAANTYTGLTTVNSAARLEVQNAGALGGTISGTTVSNGGALSLYQATDGITIADEALNLSGVGVSGANGALRNTGGNNAWNGAITLGADTRINADTSGSSGSLTIGGNISGGSNVLFMGAQGAEGKTGGNINVSGVISGSGGAYNSTTTSIYKDGAGTLTLSGANNYSGATAVNAGLLKVVSGGSISSSSTTVNNGGTLDVGGTAGNVQVNNGGLLKGSGSVGAFTLASGGTLTPGNSPGTLTAASAIILGGSTYNWEISALTGTAGTHWDLFSVGGLLDMSGVTSGNKWNLVVTGDSGFAGWTGTDSYSYVFAQAANLSLASGFSTFAGTDVTSLFNITTAPSITSKPNSSFNVNGDFKVVVGSSNGNTTLNLMAVPEPSSGSLLLAGIGSLIVLRRFRKKA